MHKQTLTFSAVLAVTASVASGQVIDSFTAGGSPVAVAFGNDEVFTIAESSGQIEVYDTTGALLRSYTHPGRTSNDIDVDIADAALNLGGTAVPAGSLLLVNGDDPTTTLYAINPVDGSLLASQALGGSTVGATFNPADGLVYSIDWSADLVRAFNPETGVENFSFTINPAGQTPIDVFYGDIDLDAAGNLQLVTDQVEQTRVLTTSGVFVEDFDVSALDPGVVFTLSGIAFDVAGSEAWVSSRGNNTIYRLAGFPDLVPEPSIAALALGGLLLRRRR